MVFTTTTENPTVADFEAAVAMLREDMKPQTVEAMETVMRAREAALKAELEAKFEAKLEAAAPLTSAVRNIVARLSKARPNWHQATVMIAAVGDDPDVDAENAAAAADSGGAWWRVGSLAVSVLLVMMQCMVVVGLVAGTSNPTCANSDHCGQGRYCRAGGIDRCTYCGATVPLLQQTDPETGGTLNYAYAADYVGFNTTLVADICADPTDRIGRDSLGNEVPYPRIAVQGWCERCVLNDGKVDDLTDRSFTQANVAAMGLFDWVTLVLASVVVALTIGGELKDIQLCDMAIRDAGDRIAPASRFVLSFLGGMRRWLFLPTLVAVVPLLVLLAGGDALSVCLNTVAILFLCEIDNLAYTVFLPERLHARAEDKGRVELGEVEASSLMWSKGVHIVAVVVVVPTGVAVGRYSHALFLSLLMFWVAGVAEVVLDVASAGEACKEVGKATGKWMLGLAGVVGLMHASVQ